MTLLNALLTPWIGLFIPLYIILYYIIPYFTTYSSLAKIPGLSVPSSATSGSVFQHVVGKSMQLLTGHTESMEG